MDKLDAKAKDAEDFKRTQQYKEKLEAKMKEKLQKMTQEFEEQNK